MHFSQLNQLKKKAISVIQNSLDEFKLNIKLDPNKFHLIYDHNLLIEHSYSCTLSEKILEHNFPRITTKVKLAHYTSRQAFTSIITSGELRLVTLKKRLKEKEFKPFYEVHNLTGMLSKNKYGVPVYDEMSERLYYTSFTNVNPNDEDVLWRNFGDNHKGVKLIFCVKTVKKMSDLRPILYRSKQNYDTLIDKINNDLKEKCNLYFLIQGIAKIGAFYLPLGFDLEKEEETRLLIKCWKEGPITESVVLDKSFSYIPIKIGDLDNPFCIINLERIIVGKKANINSIKKTLSSSNFKHTPLEILA